jgi:hypothetical protein
VTVGRDHRAWRVFTDTDIRRSTVRPPNFWSSTFFGKHVISRPGSRRPSIGVYSAASNYNPAQILHRRIHRKRREDKMAKGQLRSNREKKKPKAEKNKRKSAPVPSVFERVRMIGKDGSGKKF